MTPAPAILILAAGASSRMGEADKLLMKLDGVPCLRIMAERAVATGMRVLVTVPADRPAREAALSGLSVTIVPVRDAAGGMGRSIAAGVSALPRDVTGVIIQPADMPEITTLDLQLFAKAHEAHPNRIWRAITETGSPGHPVLFPAALFSALTALRGDEGARSVIQNHENNLQGITLGGERARLDLDTPEAWERYLSDRLR
ncbi:NTP transferase domain-containing protein [Donghicola sp. XS_ASV15]|uniref:nucleotidyltransferase family protein n=1 Tax=Donghicola sp. XS_ASV15 TaxID=3241295 RepID=UPI00351293DD